MGRGHLEACCHLVFLGLASAGVRLPLFQESRSVPLKLRAVPNVLEVFIR